MNPGIIDDGAYRSVADGIELFAILSSGRLDEICALVVAEEIEVLAKFFFQGKYDYYWKIDLKRNMEEPIEVFNNEF